MAAQKNGAGKPLFHRLHRIEQPLAISCRISGARWTERTQLPEGQVTAKHRDAGISEGTGQSQQEWCIAIRSGTVGQDKRGARRTPGRMQEAPHRRIGSTIQEWFSKRHGHQPIMERLSEFRNWNCTQVAR